MTEFEFCPKCQEYYEQLIADIQEFRKLEFDTLACAVIWAAVFIVWIAIVVRL